MAGLSALPGKPLLILAMSLATAACNDDDKNTDTGGPKCSAKIEGKYYLAAMLPYEGPWPVGETTEHGVVLAVNEINAAGGIKGEPVGLVLCNDKGDGPTAVSLMHEIVADARVSAVVGAMRSACTIPASAVAIEAGMTMLSPGSTSPAITSLADNGWINRVAASDSFQGVIAAAIAERQGYAKVFVPNINDPYGNGLREVFMNSFANASDYYSYDPATVNYARAVVDAARASSADAIFMVGFVDDSAAIVKTAINDGWSPKWIFCDGNKDQLFIDTVNNGAYLEGAPGTVAASPSGARYDGFAAKYQQAYGQAPAAYSPHGYDAVYLLAIAMALSADPFDRVQVRDNLLANTKTGTAVGPGEWDKVLAALSLGHMNYEGASGPVDLDQNGDVLSNIEEWRIHNGAIETAGCWTPDANVCP